MADNIADIPMLDAGRWPNLHDEYDQRVTEVMREGVLTEGPQTDALEREFEDYLGEPAGTVRAVSGGCQAIELILRSWCVGPGDEVIVPALTFSGTALPVLRVGARPVFADVDPRTFNVTLDGVEEQRTDRTRAVIPVHLHGLMAEVQTDPSGDSWVLEDACQAYGATANGVRAGRKGHAAAWSLNRTKTVFGGEGGLTATSIYDSDRIRSLRRFGETYQDGKHDDVSALSGYNHKITECAAAIARQSLTELPFYLDQARATAKALDEVLAGTPLASPYVPEGYEHAYHKYRVMAADQAAADTVFVLFQTYGIPVTHWQTKSLPHHPVFKGARGNWEVADSILEKSFIIGTEDRPLCSVGSHTREQWVDAIDKSKKDWV